MLRRPYRDETVRRGNEAKASERQANLAAIVEKHRKLAARAASAAKREQPQAAVSPPKVDASEVKHEGV